VREGRSNAVEQLPELMVEEPQVGREQKHYSGCVSCSDRFILGEIEIHVASPVGSFGIAEVIFVELVKAGCRSFYYFNTRCRGCLWCDMKAFYS
jgi:hypothetical protein